MYKSVVQCMLTMLKRLRESRQLAQINIAKINKRNYDRSARTRTFKERDKVLILKLENGK